MTKRPLGQLVAGYLPTGAFCCSDPDHSDQHRAEVWDRDLSDPCAQGVHSRCAHRPGGHHHGGVPVTQERTGLVYVWHCGCSCHQATGAPARRRRNSPAKAPAVVTKRGGRAAAGGDSASQPVTKPRRRSSTAPPVAAPHVGGYTRREDGERYLTPVIDTGTCAVCGRTIPQHAAGRRRRFCDSTCRKRHQRTTPPLPGL